MKNKTIIYVPVLLTFILCLFATGCSTSEEDTSTEGFRFCVQIPKSIDVETKASLGDGSEKIEITDAWIVQYSAEKDNLDNLLHCRYINQDFKGDDTGYLVEIATTKDDFTLITSDFYIILNGGADLLKDFEDAPDHSRAALLKKTCSILNSGNPNIDARPSLLTAGPARYTKVDEAEKVIIVSRVYRAFAKLSLSVKFPASSKDLFVVDEATITNIPANMALYTGGGSSSNYPDVANIVTAPKTLSGVSTSGTVSFYMPENIRGTGISSTFQGKNVVDNGPGGNLDGCTYLTLKGKYYYDKTQSGGNYVQAPIDVEYRFYLGSNLTNDYNIRRDHHYNLTINLKGANSADLRVTITNGNVAVFDEVETITNTVDF